MAVSQHILIFLLTVRLSIRLREESSTTLLLSEQTEEEEEEEVVE